MPAEHAVQQGQALKAPQASKMQDQALKASQVQSNAAVAQHTPPAAISALQELQTLTSKHESELERLRNGHTAEIELLKAQHAAAMSGCQSQRQAEHGLQTQKALLVGDGKHCACEPHHVSKLHCLDLGWPLCILAELFLPAGSGVAWLNTL